MIPRKTDADAAAPATRDDRREKVMRELKLALVDQQVHREGSGCNPYESVQGRGRSERWEPRRR
jgi:hypothetical protein